ncbi:MAG: hypothetical protein JWR23_721 [Mucilaginibacter sp.]|nr:hypothetical protein [Mucilaginibacter sp.]
MSSHLTKLLIFPQLCNFIPFLVKLLLFVHIKQVVNYVINVKFTRC